MFIFIAVALFFSMPASAAAHRAWDFQSPQGILAYLSQGPDLAAFQTYVEQELARNPLADRAILANLGKAVINVDESNEMLNAHFDRAYTIVNDAVAKKRKAVEEDLARRQREQDERSAQIRARAQEAQARAERRNVRRSRRVAPAPVDPNELSVGFTEGSGSGSARTR